MGWKMQNFTSWNKSRQLILWVWFYFNAFRVFSPNTGVLWTWLFSSRRHSAEDRIDVTNFYFRRNFGYSEEQKSLGIPEAAQPAVKETCSESTVCFITDTATCSTGCWWTDTSRGSKVCCSEKFNKKFDGKLVLCLYRSEANPKRKEKSHRQQNGRAGCQLPAVWTCRVCYTSLFTFVQ
jgi:hypothetical protein